MGRGRRELTKAKQINLYDYMEGGELASLVEEKKEDKQASAFVEVETGKKLTKKDKEAKKYEEVTGKSYKGLQNTGEVKVVTDSSFNADEWVLTDDTPEWTKAKNEYAKTASMKGRNVHINGKFDDVLIFANCFRTLNYPIADDPKLAQDLIRKRLHRVPSKAEFEQATEKLKNEVLYNTNKG